MTRSDLIAYPSRRFPSLAHSDVKQSVALVLDAMEESLSRGDCIEISGFGSFTANHRPSRIGRNPMLAEKVKVPAKAASHFNAGKELRERADQWIEPTYL